MQLWEKRLCISARCKSTSLPQIQFPLTPSTKLGLRSDLILLPGLHAMLMLPTWKTVFNLRWKQRNTIGRKLQKGNSKLNFFGLVGFIVGFFLCCNVGVDTSTKKLKKKRVAETIHVRSLWLMWSFGGSKRRNGDKRKKRLLKNWRYKVTLLSRSSQATAATFYVWPPLERAKSLILFMLTADALSCCIEFRPKIDISGSTWKSMPLLMSWVKCLLAAERFMQRDTTFMCFIIHLVAVKVKTKFQEKRASIMEFRLRKRWDS